MAHVQSVPRSQAFYQRLGFDVASTHVPEGLSEPAWAWLRSGVAQLMLARASDPPGVPQGVLFYVYVNDVAGFRQRLVDGGIAAGSIRYPFYCPRGEFRVTDPDGYVVMIAHT
jgi:hypothetical protein